MSCIYSVFLDLAKIADDIGKENIIVATNWTVNDTVLHNRDFDYTHVAVETFNLRIEE